MNDALFTPLTLPNGAILKNRLCKAAMEENLADYGQVPGKQLRTLYRNWAEGGAGLVLTGNVMVAPNALTGPGGVVLQDDTHLDLVRRWAKAARSADNHLWMQISHPGRQIYAALKEQALSPSDLALNIPGFSKLFARPRALAADEIKDIIERFITTAKLADEAGFTGVQVHAAHGYLLSQFLSPLTNQRTDEWGGVLENRARILLEIVKGIRSRVSSSFCLSVKLNSADFQKGGFEFAEAQKVVEMLNPLGVDLLELSGGSYESPAMQGVTDGSSTLKREAYFIDFARDIAKTATMPIMVTGGITNFQTAQAALERDAAGYGVSVLGLARAMAYNPALANDWQQGKNLSINIPQVKWKNKALSSLANMALTKEQLTRLSKGKAPNFHVSPLLCLIRDQIRTQTRYRRYRKWRRATA